MAQLAPRQTVYTFIDSYSINNPSDLPVFYYNASDNFGRFGLGNEGSVTVNSDSVAMRVGQNSSIVAVQNSSNYVFYVHHAGTDYLVLDQVNSFFYVGTTDAPFIVRYVNDPTIDIDAANKRYVDGKLPGITYTLVGTSTTDTQPGSDVMVIKGTTSDYIIPEVITQSSRAHLFKVEFLVKGTGSSIGDTISQEYMFGARSASDGGLIVGDTNLRNVYGSILKPFNFNMSVQYTSDYIQLYYNYNTGNSDIYLAEATVTMFNL